MSLGYAHTEPLRFCGSYIHRLALPMRRSTCHWNLNLPATSDCLTHCGTQYLFHKIAITRKQFSVESWPDRFASSVPNAAEIFQDIQPHASHTTQHVTLCSDRVWYGHRHSKSPLRSPLNMSHLHIPSRTLENWGDGGYLSDVSVCQVRVNIVMKAREGIRSPNRMWEQEKTRVPEVNHLPKDKE